MLTPEKLTKLTNNKIVDMYTELNQQLTNDIIKQLKKSGDISSYTKSQLKVLKRNGGQQVFYKALNSTQKLSKKRKKEIANLFEELEKDQMSGYKSQYDYKDVELSVSSSQILDSIIARTNKELVNMTRSVAFSSKKAYIKAVDDLYTKVVSGGWSYDKAFKSAVTELTNEGITLESKGRNYTLESTVKMNLFTAIKQTADKISEKIKDDISADAVWIAPTPYCRPTHRVINGVVMDLDDFKEHEHLTEEPNCYHAINYVIKDIFKPPLDDSEIKEMNDNADDVYVNRQKQNYLARQVRQKKKEIASLGKSSNDVLKIKRLQLRNAQAKYRIFSRANGLNVDYFQTWEAGYNGSRSR